MSRIDRRAFIAGSLSIPLAGCAQGSGQGFASLGGPRVAAQGINFLNDGYWRTGDTPVYLVTGPVKP